jgi:predicted RNA methylase
MSLTDTRELSRRARVLVKKLLPSKALGVSRTVRHWYRQQQQRAFDAKYGLDTTTMVESKSQEGSRYEATPPRLFRRILASLRIQYRDFIFIDVGSGKGPVLLYAASFPFKRIVGVEWSHPLHEIAVENIRRYRRRSNEPVGTIESFCMDARDYQFTSEPTIVYFANPFGRRIMTQLLRTIEDSLAAAPREMYVIYYLPMDDVFETSRQFRRIRSGMNYSVYRTV